MVESRKSETAEGLPEFGIPALRLHGSQERPAGNGRVDPAAASGQSIVPERRDFRPPRRLLLELVSFAFPYNYAQTGTIASENMYLFLRYTTFVTRCGLNEEQKEE